MHGRTSYETEQLTTLHQKHKSRVMACMHIMVSIVKEKASRGETKEETAHTHTHTHTHMHTHKHYD